MSRRFAVTVIDQYANEYEIRVWARDSEHARLSAYGILDVEVDTYSVISVVEVTE